MILRPVLMPIPGGADVPRSQRGAAQRRIARLAVDESARWSGLSRDHWPQDASGAPLPANGVYWSLSHKPAWTAGVVADRPVGIDLEPISPRHSDALFAKLAAPDEWERAGERTWHTFFRVWTAKEAVLKANGLGIGHLRRCRLVAAVSEHELILTFGGREWPVRQHVHHNHVVAVAGDWDDVFWSVAQGPA